MAKAQDSAEANWRAWPAPRRPPALPESRDGDRGPADTEHDECRPPITDADELPGARRTSVRTSGSRFHGSPSQPGGANRASVDRPHRHQQPERDADGTRDNHPQTHGVDDEAANDDR